MIVKQCQVGWEIISHYTHGLLAGKIAERLDPDLRPYQWVDCLTGIVEHDDFLMDFDEKNYLTESGTPLDFTMSSGTDAETLEHAKRVYGNAMQKSQMVALLVGRHLRFLYEGLRQDHSPMDDFLNTVDSKSPGQRKLYGLTKANENDYYRMLLFCDRLSLILVQDQIPQVGRKLEINKTIDNKTYYIRTLDDAHTIEPWCFENETFELDFEYRELERLTFKDNDELKNALAQAKIRLRTVSFKKA